MENSHLPAKNPKHTALTTAIGGAAAFPISYVNSHCFASSSGGQVCWITGMETWLKAKPKPVRKADVVMPMTWAVETRRVGFGGKELVGEDGIVEGEIDVEWLSGWS